MTRRQAAKRDDSEKFIVEGLKEIGCFVEPLDRVDLLVAYHGYWYVLEVKSPTQPLSKRRLTFDEKQWIMDVRNRAPVHIVETLEQAINIVRKNN